MIVSAIIDDFVERRQTIMMIDQNDLDRVQHFWNTPDTILQSLQGNRFFTGRTRWSDLSISHWRIMLVQNYKLFGTLDNEERKDLNNPVVRSLAFLLAGVVLTIQNGSGCHLTLLRLFRISEDEISYDFTASLPITIEPPEIIENTFRVVVDNT